ncbi:uncharacterized protein LOC107261061 [Ricinus communis]|uniref:uncharacterized protein LOC107261061 n=1 Tax=Ricinus communis TaxID=3988 RepID=UPI00201B2F8A|nr:uncharacterized protein LOC107261061 [Ricinus communis]
MREDEPARKEPKPEEIEPMRVEDKKKNLVKEYEPPIPYPTRLRQQKMPKYAKFLKEIMSNKRRLEDLGLVTLNEECSAILQNKLPVKRRDLGSFTVPNLIGELPISGALADLGASINLMPTSLFDKLDFIVMDMEGESIVPMILGRPFLATSMVVIDVCNRVDDKTITFDLATSMRHSLDHDDIIFSVDVSNDVVESHM